LPSKNARVKVRFIQPTYDKVRSNRFSDDKLRESFSHHY